MTCTLTQRNSNTEPPKCIDFGPTPNFHHSCALSEIRALQEQFTSTSTHTWPPLPTNSHSIVRSTKRLSILENREDFGIYGRVKFWIGCHPFFFIRRRFGEEPAPFVCKSDLVPPVENPRKLTLRISGMQLGRFKAGKRR